MKILLLLLCCLSIQSNASESFYQVLVSKCKETRKMYPKYTIDQLADVMTDWINESDLSDSPTNKLQSCTVEVSNQYIIFNFKWISTTNLKTGLKTTGELIDGHYPISIDQMTP